MTVHPRSDRAEQLMTALAGSSNIGFAVLDKESSYQMINRCLAGINEIPASAHLGVPVSEIFGELFHQLAEPHYRRVLSTGVATQFEVVNRVIPSRAHQNFWGLNANFPIGSGDGRIKQLGIFVVENTEYRKLQIALRELSGRLSGDDGERSFWYGHKIQDCLNQFCEVLGVSLEVLIRTQVDSMEQLVHSVEALDARLAAMNQLVSEISVSFPVDMTNGQK